MPEPRHVCVRGARPRPRRAARLRPRLPRVQRILPPHALPLLRPVHQRPLPPGSAPQPRRGRKKSQHNRQRSQCQDCGGASICQHNRIRSRCNDFGGASICQHNRQRGQCKDCGDTSTESATITARGAGARTAVAPTSASITARGDDDVFCQLRNYAAAEGRVAPRQCSCGRRCQRAWAS